MGAGCGSLTMGRLLCIDQQREVTGLASPMNPPASESQMEITEQTSVGLYSRVLGPKWNELHATVRRFHAAGQTVRATGLFRVCHGTNWVSRCATRLARLPAAGEAVAVQLAVIPQDEGEEWSRIFNNRPMCSFQSCRPNGLLAEAMGPLEIRFRLDVVDGALIYHPGGAALRLGSLRLPLPRWLAPSVSAWEKQTADPQRIEVSIQVTSPLLGLLVTYGGTVTIVEAPRGTRTAPDS